MTEQTEEVTWLPKVSEKKIEQASDRHKKKYIYEPCDNHCTVDITSVCCTPKSTYFPLSCSFAFSPNIFIIGMMLPFFLSSSSTILRLLTELYQCMFFSVALEHCLPAFSALDCVFHWTYYVETFFSPVQKKAHIHTLCFPLPHEIVANVPFI